MAFEDAHFITFTNGSGNAINDDNLNAIQQWALLNAHPVGSYYWSSENTNPSRLFGGTWEQVKDKFVYALGDTGSAGDTGGSETKTLSVANLPSHNHAENAEVWMNQSGSSSKYLSPGSTGSNYFNTETAGGRSSKNTGNTGSGTAFSIMPPYVKAYCWHRTA